MVNKYWTTIEITCFGLWRDFLCINSHQNRPIKISQKRKDSSQRPREIAKPEGHDLRKPCEWRIKNKGSHFGDVLGCKDGRSTSHRNGIETYGTKPFSVLVLHELNCSFYVPGFKKSKGGLAASALAMGAKIKS